MPAKKKPAAKKDGEKKGEGAAGSGSFEKAGPSNVAFGLQMLANSIPEGGAFIFIFLPA